MSGIPEVKLRGQPVIAPFIRSLSLADCTEEIKSFTIPSLSSHTIHFYILRVYHFSGLEAK
jgi:hypothetical protein